ncbi:hypothetical protein [Nitrososphaera sp.]|uniref:hypothetical protein n=1 Tax=Nitrososphaera sp. TaxID=1971748 RepID=UPI00307EBEB7
MYAKFCSIEILSSYIKEVSVGDMLTVQALVTNPLDWQHFYEKISSIKKGDRTDFMVVTGEGDRLAGQGDVVEVEKWSNKGHYGFKIKLHIRKQKSLTDRRTRAPKKPPAAMAAAPAMTAAGEKAAAAPQVEAPARLAPPEAVMASAEDIASFKEMLKGSLAMDIPA